MSGGTICFIGIECVRVRGPVRASGILTEDPPRHPDHTKPPYHCSLEPAMVADERQWNQQFTSEPPVRPVDELSTAMNKQRACFPPRHNRGRCLSDVHQLRSARVTYEGNITSKRKN
jgi:hypothetical protein